MLYGTVIPRLPYRLRLDVRLQRCDRPRLVEATIDGDLCGRAALRLEAAGDGTRAEVAWSLEMHSAPLRVAAHVAYPLMRWSHDRVVDMTVAGFRRRALPGRAEAPESRTRQPRRAPVTIVARLTPGNARTAAAFPSAPSLLGLVRPCVFLRTAGACYARREPRLVRVEQHVAALDSDLGISSDQTADLALRYLLDNPAVSTIIAGMRTVRNVERNTAVSDGRPLTSEQRAKLRAHRWEQSFYLPT